MPKPFPTSHKEARARMKRDREPFEPEGEPKKLGIMGNQEESNEQLRRITPSPLKAGKVDLTKTERIKVEQSTTTVLHAPNRPGKKS